jgi:hypothetical protein
MPTNSSAQLLSTRISEGHFTWLISADMVAEYKAVLMRLGVRPQVLGRIINLLHEEAEEIHGPRIVEVRLFPETIPYVPGPNIAARTS